MIFHTLTQSHTQTLCTHLPTLTGRYQNVSIRTEITFIIYFEHEKRIHVCPWLMRKNENSSNDFLTCVSTNGVSLETICIIYRLGILIYYFCTVIFIFVVVTTGRECMCVFFSFFLLLFRSSSFSFRFSLFTFSHSFNFFALFLPNEITFVMKMYTYICICVGYMCKERVLYFVGVEIYIFMSVYSV